MPRPASAPRRPAAPPARAPAAPPPAWWRDPWAAAVAACVLPLLALMRGAHPGEPFSDDFQFLDFSVLRHNPSWWNGGGGLAYWRPLTRQAYFSLLGPLALDHPLWLAALHAGSFAAAAVLVYRALRPAWPAPAAAVAGAFPLWLEAARVLVVWPSGAQDLGALFFLALALHAASRGRLALLAAAGVAAALSKEVAAPLVLLVPLAPFAPPARSWRRALPVVASAMGAWGLARFALPHGDRIGFSVLASPEATAAPLLPRVATALAWAAHDAFGIAQAQRAGTVLPVLAFGAAAVSALALTRERSMRSPAWRWSAWGLAWFAAAAAPLALFVPDRAPWRSTVPAVGLGVALVAPLAFAARAWLLPLVAARLAALLAAPQPPGRIGLDALEAGAPDTYPSVALLQRCVGDVHHLLARTAPTLPPRTRVVREAFPQMAGVAFAGDQSLCAWYRDTTLRWAASEDMRRGRVEDARAMIEFEPDRTPQWAEVDLPAMRSAIVAVRELNAARYADALRELDRCERAQRDTSAAQFLASVEAWRSLALLDMGRLDAAQAAAGLALGHSLTEHESRNVIARVYATRGDWARARDVAREQLEMFPADERARALFAAAVARAGLPAR